MTSDCRCLERKGHPLIPFYLRSIVSFVSCPETPETLIAHGSCGGARRNISFVWALRVKGYGPMALYGF